MSSQRVSCATTVRANNVGSAAGRRHTHELRRRGTIAAWLGGGALILGVGAALGAPAVAYAAPVGSSGLPGFAAHFGHEGGGIATHVDFGHEGGGIATHVDFGHEGGGIATHVDFGHEDG